MPWGVTVLATAQGKRLQIATVREQSFIGELLKCPLLTLQPYHSRSTVRIQLLSRVQAHSAKKKTLPEGVIAWTEAGQ